MTSEQTASENPRLQWWAKIALWTLVLAFGYLYLSSIRPSGDEQAGPGGEPAAGPAGVDSGHASPVQATGPGKASEPSGVAATVAPAPALVETGAEHAVVDVQGSAPEQVAASEATPQGEPAEAAAASDASAAPVSAAESAAFADTLMKPEPTSPAPDKPESAAPEALPVPQPAQAAVAAPAPAATPAPAVEAAPRSAQPLRPTPAPVAASPASPVASASAASAPGAGTSPAPAAETAGERRARIMAEYEVMRRQTMPAYPPRPRAGGANRYYYPGYGPRFYQGEGNR